MDRAKAVTKELGGETLYVCSEHCLHAFEQDAAATRRSLAWSISRQLARAEHHMGAPT
jgi:hypothetical protein